MWVLESFRRRGRYPGIVKSEEGIDELRLVSQRGSRSGDFSTRNESTLQKLVRILQMLEKEMIKCLSDF